MRGAPPTTRAARLGVTRALVATIAVAVGLLALARAAQAADLIVPESWAGEWTVTITYRNATTNRVVAVDEITDIVCANEPAGLVLFGSLADCAGSVSESRLEVRCSTQFSQGACSLNATLQVLGERAGDTLSGVGEWTATLSGACPTLPVSEGLMVDVSGVRLSADQSTCGQPGSSLVQKFVRHPLLVILGACPLIFADDKVEIEGDDFEVKTTFTLGACSNGIFPLAENVRLAVGPFATTIPAGSFRFKPARPGKRGRPGKPAEFTFEGTRNGASLEVKLTELAAGSFELKAEGEGADLTGIANPVIVELTIGADGGSIAVTAEIEGDDENDDDD